jgi:hypothetical protein
MLRWCAAAQFDVRYQICDRKGNVVVCLSGVVPPIHYDQWTDKLGGSWVGRTRTCSLRVRAQNKAKRKCIEVTRMTRALGVFGQWEREDKRHQHSAVSARRCSGNHACGPFNNTEADSESRSACVSPNNSVSARKADTQHSAAE